MLQDTQLELSPWSTRTGPGIGGPVPFVAPTSFTVTQPTSTNQYLEVSITGSAYTDGMAVQQRPWIAPFDPSQICIRYEFDIFPKASAATCAQAIETDLRISSPSGYNYNGSFQNNYEEKGQIQVYGVAPNPAWRDTGIMVGLYVQGPQHVEINYLINDTNTTANGMPPFSMSIVSFELAGKLYPIPVALQNNPGDNLKWTPGLYEQLQLDLNYAGGSFAVGFRNIACDWM
jgi:hypothetical protein